MMPEQKPRPFFNLEISVVDAVSSVARPVADFARRLAIGHTQNWAGRVHGQNIDAMMEILDMAKKHEDEKREGRTDPVVVQGHEVLTDAGPVRSPENMMEGPMAAPSSAPTTRGRKPPRRR